MSGLKVLANILRALVAILLKSDIEQFSIIDSNLMGVMARMDFLCLAAATWVSDFRKKIFIVCRNKTTVVSSFKH